MLYQLTVVQFSKALNSLNAIFDKGAAHAEAKKFDVSVLLNSRLAPNQFTLIRQVQIACDTAKLGVARLIGTAESAWGSALAVPVLLVVVMLAAASGVQAATTASPSASPTDAMTAENTAVGEKVMAMAAQAAESLNGEGGDLHRAITAAGNRELMEYSQLQRDLAAIKEETGATYVYTLIKISDEMTNLIAEASVGDDADDYGTEYGMEPQMSAAFAGEPAYAEHTWTDESYGVQKSAFAPLLDNSGSIVAIVGIDFPAPELEKYDSELNVDAAE